MTSPLSASKGLALAIGGAIAVLCSLWLPWYTIRIPQALRDIFSGFGSAAGQGTAPAPAGQAAAPGLEGAISGMFKGLAAAIPSSLNITGWQVMHGGDVALAAIAGIALLAALAASGQFAGVRVERAAAGRMIGALGLAALLVALYHVITRPGNGSPLVSDAVSLRYGLWIAVVGALAMLAGGMAAGGEHEPAPAIGPALAVGAAEPSLPWDTGASAAPPPSAG